MYVRFFVLNQNLTAEHIKIVKNYRFFWVFIVIFVQNSLVFQDV